jgi:hypothetical protein
MSIQTDSPSPTAQPERGTTPENRREWVGYIIARCGLPPRLREMVEMLHPVGHCVSIGTVRRDYIALGIQPGQTRGIINQAARLGIIPRSCGKASIPPSRPTMQTFLSCFPDEDAPA